MMLQRTTTDERAAFVARLTPKERECLDRWLAHATAKEIALDLGITHHAVEKRLKSARAKLGVTSTLEAARILAAAEGYGQAVSQSSELAQSETEAQVSAVDPVAATVSRRNLARIAMGVLCMSMLALSALLLSGTQVSGTAPQAASAAPRVITVNRSPNQKAELDSAFRTAFAALNRDNDGVLAGAELSTAKFRVLRMNAANAASNPEGNNGLQDLDADRDGRVTRDEFLTGMTAMTRSQTSAR